MVTVPSKAKPSVWVMVAGCGTHGVSSTSGSQLTKENANAITANAIKMIFLFFI
jgi:hypothetical protein